MSATLPSERYGLSCAPYGDSIYCFGGVSGSILNQIVRYIKKFSSPEPTYSIGTFYVNVSNSFSLSGSIRSISYYSRKVSNSFLFNENLSSSLASSSSPPAYTNIQTYYPENFTRVNSTFNITWINNSGRFGIAYLENNFTGTLQNTSMTLLWENSTHHNFTYSIMLPSGNYKYRFLANTTAGWTYTNYYTFTINKMWNQTNNVIAEEEYEYDLNMKGTPIILKNKTCSALNESVIVDEDFWINCNFTFNNTNNNTGLTTTFKNVLFNLSKHINISIWKNNTGLEITLPSIEYNEIKTISADLYNKTAYLKNYSCEPTQYTTYKKYDCNFSVVVIENETTKLYPIILYINYSSLPEFLNRDKALTNWYVDGKVSGTTYEELESQNKSKITVTTSFSTSSLSQGEHIFNLIYWIPIATGGAGGGGGGGGFISQQPQMNVSFEITPLTISKFSNPGESKAIISTPEGYTFLIKNTGPEPIFIKIKIEGDYKDWISFYDTKRLIMQIYNKSTIIPEYISIEPGKTAGITLFTNIPSNAKVGSYQVSVLFIEKNTNVYKTATINIVVSPATLLFSTIDSAMKKLLYPIIFSNDTNKISISKNGIVIPSRVEASIPVGWLLFLLTYTILYYVLKHMFRVGIKDRKTIKSYIIHLVSIGATIVIIFFVM
jgi:hypothetical protein